MNQVMEISLDQKVKILKKYLHIGGLALGSAGDKKILGYCKKILSVEAKYLRGNKYALIDDDVRPLIKCCDELIGQISALCAEKDGQKAEEVALQIDGLCSKLYTQIAMYEGLLHPQSPAEGQQIGALLYGSQKPCAGISA